MRTRTAAVLAAVALVSVLLAGCSSPQPGPLASLLEQPQTPEDRIGTVIHLGQEDTIGPASTRHIAEHDDRTYLVGRLEVAKQLCLIVLHADSVDWETASCGTLPIVAEWDSAHGPGKARLLADGADVAEDADSDDLDDSDGAWTVLTPNLAVQPG
jgi:hypothetical protein